MSALRGLRRSVQRAKRPTCQHLRCTPRPKAQWTRIDQKTIERAVICDDCGARGHQRRASVEKPDA